MGAGVLAHQLHRGVGVKDVYAAKGFPRTLHQRSHLPAVGHIQMRGEDPAQIIRQAGERLSYVHLDDNDGVGDLHWSLLDGVMTRDSLGSIFAALTEIGYDGGVSLELSPKLPDPFAALQASREIVLRIASL